MERQTIKNINDAIRANKIRLVGEGFHGEIVTLEEALNKAEDLKLDLVQMSETGKDGIATCKIMNYGKYLYAQEKKAKANKQSKQDVKEIRLSDTIADNDIKTKAKNADKFLRDGDRVNVYVVYNGRQMAYMDRGFDVLKRFESFLTVTYKVVKPAKIDGNRVGMTIELSK